MSLISKEYLNTIINRTANALELTHLSYNEEQFENIAQNYFGVLIPVKVNGKYHQKDLRFSITLKLAPPDERYRVSGAVTIMFAREIFVYSKILPKYQEFQRKYSLSNYVVPKCYYVCSEYCKEAIAMQNMCEINYIPFVKSMFLDLEHIKIAIKSLAQFHALSFILKESDVVFFEEAIECCVPLTLETNKRYIDILLDRLNKAIIKFENSPHVLLLEELKQKCVRLIESTSKLVKNVCLCHGDMWKENILFQYVDNTPQSACIIDYQTTRVSSPAFDFLYLIVSSTKSSLRKNNFHDLLELYYKTFEQTLYRANVNPAKTYTKDMLIHDLHIVGPACLIVVNTAIWLSSGLQEEGHVRSKIRLNTDDEKIRAIGKYKETIQGVIEDLTNYGFLKTAFE